MIGDGPSNEDRRPPRNPQTRGKQPEFSLPRPPQGEGLPMDDGPPMDGLDGQGPPQRLRQPQGGNGAELDPLMGIDDEMKALRSKLLAVPSLRARYLDMVKTLAREMEWSKLGAFITQERDLIATYVERDTRKLSKYEDFLALTSDAEIVAVSNDRAAQSLRAFVTLRSKYLIAYKASNKDSTAASRPPAAAPSSDR